MKRFYTVNEAAAALHEAYPGLGSGAPEGREPDAWSQEIIRAILDGKLVGISDGRPIDPKGRGAAVAAVLCKMRADDLNMWLEALRSELRFDESPDSSAGKVRVNASNWIGVARDEMQKYVTELLKLNNKIPSQLLLCQEIAYRLKVVGIVKESGTIKNNVFRDGWKYKTQ
jgi:hypothetical protein